jgi:dephospho-CoA kinase
VLRIGLTGGIASGKSMVADMFVAHGATLIDTDAIAREVVAAGEPGLAAVREAFGDAVLAADGTLNRRALRAVVFADESSRRKLESILHPLIRERAVARMAAADGPYLVVAVPLLVETGFGELVDRVLVVDCAVQTQIDRLMKRDKITEQEAAAAVAAQADRQTRLAAADDVIDNDGPPEATRMQVAQLHRNYLALAGDCRAGPGRAK